jgi:hypothetical protein
MKENLTLHPRESRFYSVWSVYCVSIFLAIIWHCTYGNHGFIPCDPCIACQFSSLLFDTAPTGIRVLFLVIRVLRVNFPRYYLTLHPRESGFYSVWSVYCVSIFLAIIWHCTHGNHGFTPCDPCIGCQFSSLLSDTAPTGITVLFLVIRVLRVNFARNYLTLHPRASRFYSVWSVYSVSIILPIYMNETIK